jgi:type VI secretion system secreted protein VgrG
MSATDFKIQLSVQGQNPVVDHLQGQEAISQPFYFKITCVLLTYSGKAFLLQPALLQLSSTRTIAGFITHVLCEPYDATSHKLIFTFESRLALLKCSHSILTFTERSIPDVVTILLQQAGFNDSHICFSLHQDYAKKPYVLQAPAESDFDFLARLVAKAGIFYWFDTDSNDNENIHLADHQDAFPTLTENPSYIAATGLVNGNGFDHLEIQARKVDGIVQITDHNEMHPSMKINASAAVGEDEATRTMFGLGALNQTEAQHLAQLQAEHEKSYALRVVGNSNLADLKSGYVCQLNADEFSNTVSGNYLIVAVQHQMQQAEFYHNTATLLPRTLAYRDALPAHPAMPPVYHAFIESRHDVAELDQHGRYRLRPRWDLSDAPNAQASPPIARIQPYGGPVNDSQHPPVGFHTPLLPNTEVLISCLHGDPDRPVILAAAPNARHPSPITNKNPTQHRLVSALGHQILLDDHNDNPRIQLNTPQEQNRIEMSAKPNEHQFNVISKQGKIHYQAQQGIHMESGENTQEIIGGKRIQTAKYNTRTEAEDIHHQAATDFILHAKQDLLANAKQQLAIKAGKTLNISAGKQLTVQGNQTVHLHSANGKVLFESGGDITVLGSGKGNIEFGHDLAGFQITPGGVINIYGKQVLFQSPGQLTLKGNVQYHNEPAPPMHLQPMLQPVTVKSIPELKPQNGKLKAIEDELTLQFNFDGSDKKTQNLQFLEGVRYRIFSLASEKEINSLPAILAIYNGTIKQAQLEVKGIDLEQPFSIELTDPNSHQALYVIAQQGKPCAPNNCWLISANSNEIKQKTDPQLPDKIIQTRQVILSVLHPVIHFNFRIATLQHIEQLYTAAGLSTADIDINNVKTNLQYFTPDENVNNDRCALFTPEQIHFLKENGNNATLFIHGYSVGYGEYGKDFVLRQDDAGETIIWGYSDRHCVVFRNPEHGILQHYANAKNLTPDKVIINGSEAHQWWTCMSDNLNRATGQFNYKDYTRYTSVIGIAWQGDPTNPADYIASVHLAKYTGAIVAKLAEQLIAAGIQVNIIAHSLGNQVLMRALDVLGKTKQSVNHVFMWDAAIPDNAFTTVLPDPKASMDADNLYYFPYAYAGAKKFTVLFSHQDNVLGPFHYHLFSNLKDYIKENFEQQKYDGNWFSIILAIAAIAACFFRLPDSARSFYGIANMIGRPFSYLFYNSENRENYYQAIRTKHPFAFLPATLDEQLHIVRQKHFNVFSDLSRLLKIYGDYGPSGDAADFHKDISIGLVAELEKIEDFLTEGPLIVHEKSKLGYYYYQSTRLQDRRSDELATLIITVFTCQTTELRSAMGYQGPDYQHDHTTNDLWKTGKLILADQKHWLAQHCAMEHPSHELMEHVYIPFVYDGMQSFGRYK